MTIYLRVVKRHFWVRRVEEQWRQRSILWLRGVRRAGKTFLAQSLDAVEYFDCGAFQSCWRQAGRLSYGGEVL